MLVTPVNNAPKEYNQDEESRFRRQIELYLESLSSDVSRASSLEGTVASLASKRGFMTSIPVGVVTVG